MAMSFISLRSSHWELGSTTKKATKNPTKGLQTKIPGKAKTLQNKGFAPKCGEAPGAKKHQKKQRKNAPKTQKRRTKQKSQVKPNTCKIKGLPRNLAKPRAPKEKAKKRQKTKKSKRPKSFCRHFWGFACGSFLPFGQDAPSLSHSSSRSQPKARKRFQFEAAELGKATAKKRRSRRTRRCCKQRQLRTCARDFPKRRRATTTTTTTTTTTVMTMIMVMIAVISR